MSFLTKKIDWRIAFLIFIVFSALIVLFETLIIK